MASDTERPAAAEETVVLDADDVQRQDEDWPVADVYLVEPDDDFTDSGSSAEPAAEADPGPARRRLPPGGVLVLLLAIGGTTAALMLGAVLLNELSSDGSNGPARAAAVQGDTTPTTGPATQSPSSQERELPNLAGMSAADARATLDELGFESRVVRVESDEPQGRVVRQTPGEGTRLSRGEVVVLFLSRGGVDSSARLVSVPRVLGVLSSKAVLRIRAAGLVARIRLVGSSQRAGVVLRQSPQARSQAKSGSTVELVVARSRPAPARAEVPDVRGLDVTEARSTLQSLGLAVAVVRISSQEPAGTVLRQTPPAGAELRKGGTVRLTVSSGRATIDVPDVTGLDEQSARLELENAGFVVRVTDETTTDPAQDGIVVGQAPAAGASLEEGAVVTLVVARYA